MPKAPLIELNNGYEIPAVGLGVFQSPPEETTGAVEAAIAYGYSLIDTAAAYGNEREVGEAVRASGIDRNEILVESKLWISDYGYDNALRGFEGSLKRLGLDYVDIYLLHQPAPRDFEDTIAAYKALEKMLADGRTRAIGVSNFMPEQLNELLARTEVVPALNQIEIHPYFSQPEVRKANDDHGILNQAWSPIGGVYSYGKQSKRVLENPTLVALAEKHGKTPAQIVLRWHLDTGRAPIPKSVKPHRIAENIDIFDFSLAENEIAEIDALDTGVRGGPDPASINTSTYQHRIEND